MHQEKEERTLWGKGGIESSEELGKGGGENKKGEETRKKEHDEIMGRGRKLRGR